MSQLHVGETHELVIDRLAYQGFGVGRKDGFVFFVDDSCPGDNVLVRIEKLKPTCAFAKIVRIISPSRLRKVSECLHSETCGGCQWQHVSYQEQIKQKSQILGKIFSQTDVEVMPSPKPLGYRNRIRLHWDGRVLGMFARKSHTLFEISNCAIANPLISEKISQIKSQLASEFPRRKKHVDVTTKKYFVTDFEDAEYPPFSQVNDAMNLILQDFVSNQISINSKSIFDLYCGEGNFTKIAAARAPSANITGVESNRESIGRVKESEQVKFLNMPVEKFLASHPTFSSPSTVILDPPRSGCGLNVMTLLLDFRPDTIIYISCDPMTLNRDLKILTEKPHSKYKLDSIKGFDMFPQTYHVETVAVLKKQQ